MELVNKLRTVTIPLFNQSNGLNSFQKVNNKLVIEYEMPQKKTENFLSINKAGYKINNCSFQKIEILEFFLPKGFKLNLDFESDVTITYENINGGFYLKKINVLYSDDYVEIMESGWNLYPELVNGKMKFSKQNHKVNINSAC